ncbi:RAI1-domain-containing protein [Macrolepiota fuliginosa MF-IS2]|uniref:Decapping nuclease n=1 Tax=Macrolepiota fuliginosa MF-IS2 TaxID=1400762 RepID=A0A9P5X9A5_9AGAR|nr:RAI1-domain-containing protein [Macrolepiota fuliginosa MF-IS2]
MAKRPRSEEQDTRSLDLDDNEVEREQEQEQRQLSYPDTTTPLPRSVVPPPFQQPTQLMTFSYSEERELVFDDSALRYYVEPPRGAKLDYGYGQWVKQVEERGRIDSLLRALSRVRGDPTRQGAVKELGVVSWRGVMTKILTAPYEERDGWELNVMNVNGTLYFEEYVSDTRVQEKQSMNAKQSLQTYYGYAFESYCTADAPHRPKPDPTSRVPFGWSGDVNNNVQWCSVVRTKLGNTRILIGGEVDCVRGKLYTGQPDTFVELKTSLTIRGPHDEARFEKKLLKFYFQSFLLGVPEIIVGFRTPGGVVSMVQPFRTVEIPRLVRGKPGAWDPLLCLDWGNRFLTLMQNTVVAHSPADDASSGPSVWRVRFSPGTGIRVRQLNATDMEDVMRGEDRVGILPRWYWDEIGV